MGIVKPSSGEDKSGARRPLNGYKLDIYGKGFNSFAAREAFLEAMRRAGLDPRRPIVADGKFHDVRTSTAKGWYIYHEQFDHSYGAFGDWRSKRKETWSSRRLTSEEKHRIAEERRENEAEANGENWASQKAKHIWRWTREAPASHPYLKRKGVDPHGVHLYYGRRELAGVALDGAIVVPVYNDEEQLQALQFICADGKKRNLGPISGGHLWIGTPKSWHGTLFIAEGFATAASVYEETRRPCCVSFGVGGFQHVARYVRDRYDPKRLVIVADGDEAGITAANAAARAVNARVYVCADGQDFNDMCNARRE